MFHSRLALLLFTEFRLPDAAQLDETSLRNRIFNLITPNLEPSNTTTWNSTNKQ